MVYRITKTTQRRQGPAPVRPVVSRVIAQVRAHLRTDDLDPMGSLKNVANP